MSIICHNAIPVNDRRKNGISISTASTLLYLFIFKMSEIIFSSKRIRTIFVSIIWINKESRFHAISLFFFLLDRWYGLYNDSYNPIWSEFQRMVISRKRVKLEMPRNTFHDFLKTFFQTRIESF